MKRQNYKEKKMKKLIDFFKVSDKTGIKLGGIVLAEKLLQFFAKWQSMFITFYFLGALSSVLEKEILEVIMTLFTVWFMISVIRDIVYIAINREVKRLRMFGTFIMILGYGLAVNHFSLTEVEQSVFPLYLFSGIFYLVVRYALSKILVFYIERRILDMNYLSSKDLIADVEARYGEEAFVAINQKAVQDKYQNFVSCTYLGITKNTTVKKVELAGEKKTIDLYDYKPECDLEFRIFPFGTSSSFSLLLFRYGVTHLVDSAL